MVILKKIWGNLFSTKLFSVLWNMRQEINAIIAPEADPMWSIVGGCLGVSEEDIAEHLIKKAQKLLGKKKLDAITKEDFLQFFDYNRYYTSVLVHGLALLKKAKQAGCKTYLLSNIGKEDYEHLLQHPDLREIVDLTDGQILSYKVGAVKPKPEIYKKLLDTYNLKPEDCFFIDNKQVMVDGAQAVGIDGIVFENPEEIIEKFNR